MVPFDSYPSAGRALFKVRAKGSNCRWEYGLQLMKLTGQKTCAYCDVDFTTAYAVWLTMALDHVVPSSVCKANNIPEDWAWDYSNTVLACGACNGFCNRYKPSIPVGESLTLEGFYDLRDRIFEERKQKIKARHLEERAFFERNPWSVMDGPQQ
jgi:hypothetical protein